MKRLARILFWISLLEYIYIGFLLWAVTLHGTHAVDWQRNHSFPLQQQSARRWYFIIVGSVLENISASTLTPYILFIFISIQNSIFEFDFVRLLVKLFTAINLRMLCFRSSGMLFYNRSLDIWNILNNLSSACYWLSFCCSFLSEDLAAFSRISFSNYNPNNQFLCPYYESAQRFEQLSISFSIIMYILLQLSFYYESEEFCFDYVQQVCCWCGVR